MKNKNNETEKISFILSEKDDLYNILNQGVRIIRNKVLSFIENNLKNIGFEVIKIHENNHNYVLECNKNDIKIKIECYIFSNGNYNLIYKIRKNNKTEYGRFCSIENFIRNINNIWA
mgnify:CR=1 FL=1